MSTIPRHLLQVRYARAAQEYLHSLPLEHFMEATAQGTQREITLESLALVKGRRGDVQVFNELLLQYRLGRRQTIRQVVPDNMVVVHSEPIQADTSYDVELQPVGPLIVLEYVSKNSARKDYEDSFRKYERELKVPYYLLFYPDNQDLTLFRLQGRRYVSTKPNRQGRYSVAQLDLEVALLDGWVRYWYQGELLPLPVELQRELDELRRQLAQEKRRTDQLQEEVEEERQARLAAEREVAELRAQLARRPKNGRS